MPARKAEAYTYDAANRLTSAAGQTYTWDNNGNLTSDGVRTYDYDHANRLKQVTEGSLTTQFAYDGDGVRASKTVDATTTDYVVDLATTLPVVISDTDAIYLYGLDIIAEQLAQPDRYYYVHDGLGSVRQLLDNTGQIAETYAYDPFGVPLSADTVYNPFRFTGEVWDAEGELLYLRARYYQPATGRFITKDPWPGDVRRPGTLNRYVYVGNNPVNMVDPTGLQCMGPHCGPQPSGPPTPETSPPGAPSGPVAIGTPIPPGAAPSGTAGPTLPPEPSPPPTPMQAGTPGACNVPTPPPTALPSPPLSFEEWKAQFPSDPYWPLPHFSAERLWLALEAQMVYLDHHTDISSAALSKLDNPLGGGDMGPDHFGRLTGVIWYTLLNSRKPPFPQFIEVLGMDRYDHPTNFEPYFLTLLISMHHDDLKSAQRVSYLQCIEGWSEGRQEFWEGILDRMMLSGGIYEEMYIWSTTQE